MSDARITYGNNMPYWITMTGVIGMVISLPLFEGIKNISIVIAAIGFILCIAKSRTLPRLYPIGFGFLMMLIAFLITTFFAPIVDLKAHIRGINNLWKMFFVFLIIANIAATEKESRIIAWLLLLSALVGEVWGIIDIIIGKKRVLEMHSVGQFNHTGIYLAMMLSLNLGMLFSLNTDSRRKMLLLLLFILSAISLFFTTSRGAMLGFFVFLAVFPIIVKNYKAISIIIAFLILSIISVYLYAPLRMKLTDPASMSARFEIWKDAFSIFMQSPVVGIGYNQYNKWAAMSTGHAHNLNLNTIVQSGIIGLIALGGVFWGFLKTWFAAKSFIKDESDMAYWTAGLGAFIIVVVSGIFNTTLHSEHGLLFSILAGICASLTKRNYSR